MKLVDFYKKTVQEGLKTDPRGAKRIKKYLAQKRKKFNALKGVLRASYDRENLTHPFTDTRVLYGAPATEVRTILLGVDIGVGELLLADRLNQKGAGIDLVVSHHPSGAALAGLPEVMSVHQDILESLGIAKEIGEEMLRERMNEVSRRVHPGNIARSVDAARLLDFPFMCAHTPADNHVVKYLTRFFSKKKPKKLSDMISVLCEIPEYVDAVKQSIGPRILVGKKTKHPGKIFVDMTGGTEGPKKGFARLSQAGVGTIVAMHLSEEQFKNAKSEHMNIILAGHTASDNLGLNLLLDSVTKNQDIRIIPCSGFVRVKR